MVTDPAGTSGVGRPQLITPFRYVVALTSVLVLFQAALAGRGMFDDFDYFDVHEIVANFVFLSVLVQLGLAIALRVPASFRTSLLAVNGLLLVLVIVQISLGYSIEYPSEAGAWHVLNGVFIFGVAVYNLTFLDRLRR